MKVLMKFLKRNGVVLGILVFVCAAVYLNWSFGNRLEEQTSAASVSDAADQTVAGGNGADASGLYFTPAATLNGEKNAEEQPQPPVTDIAEYFAAVRLSRSQARDEATQTLQVACAASDASQEFVMSAATQIIDIAQWTMQEADLENLIRARGFEDCVVYMTEKGISVTVPAPVDGLSDASVAKITDVILTETDYAPDQLRIVEVR